MHKNHLHLLIFLLLGIVACNKPIQDNLEEDKIAIQSILIQGQEYQDVKIQSLVNNTDITNAKVEVFGNSEQYNFEYLANGIYRNNSNFDVTPNVIYQLEITIEDQLYTSETQIPDSMAWDNINQTVITVDPDNGGQPAFAASWVAGSQSSFAVTLQNIENNPLEIFHDVSTLSFEEVYKLPLQSSFINFNDLFLTHYGVHRLTVYGLDEEYKDVFFYQPQVQQNNPSTGIDNILGAKGYFVGVSSLSVDIMVN